MPQFDDNVYLGPATAGGPLSSTGNSAPMTRGVGPVGRVYLFDVLPLTLQANGLATTQNPGSGGTVVLTAGTGVTTTLDANGVTRYVLDTPRGVTCTAAGANSATYRVAGYDVYGQPMTANIPVASTLTTSTLKAFKSVTSITNTNTTAGTNNLTFGFNDVFGLPVVVSDFAYIQSVKWAQTLANNAGTPVVADATSPATAATGDVRGTFLPTSASNGTRRLVMFIAVPGIAAGPNATRVEAFGVTQV